ncbi:TonB-dependent receptor domain-containing protein [Marilutibacter alkalisoli]|uniref:TonB-dependent receptor domain-containing protein n=1 Tax=Marilutibacter alkalisoli TaxID=2591633 RepID=UPI00141FC62B|nr:TonB-dependent receptor [Lysobacter alkalisoli]
MSTALFAAMLLPVATGAFAQEEREDSQEQEQTSTTQTTDIDKVVVVGSRISRAQIESAAPVTVLTRADIEREGYQTVADVLQVLSQNTASSFTGDLGVTGFSPNAMVVNLRNLGPGYTLVLLDGKRPAQYPQPYNRDNNVVNVKALPSSLIERVEVLAGGASAIYGSDAVAGVVNIVTRKNFEGNEIRATVGTTSNGGGDSVSLEYAGGRSAERWHTTFGFQYSANEPVFASQRDWLSDTRQNPYGLVVNPSLSLVAIDALGVVVAPNHNAIYPGEDVCDQFGYRTVTTAARGLYCGSHTQVGSRSIWNKGRSYSGYGNATFDATDDIQLFGSATYYTSDGKSSSGTEFWGTAGDQFNQTAAGGQTPFFYDPNIGTILQLQRVFNPFELGGSEAASTLYDETTWSVQGGLRGDIADRFDWEASAAYSRYDYTADRPRLLSKAVHEYFLGEQLGLDPFFGFYPVYELDLDRWSTPLTPEQYRAISTRVINEGKTTSSSVDFTLTGDLWEMPAGPVGFAGIIEAVRQTTDLRSDPRLDVTRPLDENTVYNLVSSGRTSGERDRYAVGAEFRVPITSMLTAQLAGRYDKYDDITSVDDAFTYNLGLEFRPFESLLLRGTVATSFKAPDMQLVFAEGAASFSSVLDEYSCRSGTGPGEGQGPRTRAECNQSGDPTIYQTQTRIAGNPLLEEEESKSYTVGFVWDIIDGLSFTADYYRIKLENAASQLGNDFILQAEAACRLGSWSSSAPRPDLSDEFCSNIESFVTRLQAPGTPGDGRLQSINSAYINTAIQDTSGIDASFRFNHVTDRMGTFFANAEYTLVLTNKYAQFDFEPVTDYRDLPPTFFNPERSRARWSAGWSKDDWRFTWAGTRFGSAWGDQEENGCLTGDNEHVCYSRRLKPYIRHNLSVEKKFGANLVTQLSVLNVLDNQFREDPGNTAYPYYNPWLGADPLGRRFHFSINYKF